MNEQDNKAIDMVPEAHLNSEEIKKAADQYSAEEITVLHGLDAVRVRPGMYIGSTGITGLHHLVYEIVDNSVDEAMAGYCTQITIRIDKGEIISVEDNGRGIPVAIHPELKVSALEVVLATLHAGGKFDNEAYKVSGGLHGVGSSVVNALSDYFEANVYRDGHIYAQKYAYGVKKEEVHIIGDSDRTGTVIKFHPDYQIMERNEMNFDVLCERFRELAFLTKGLKIVAIDDRYEAPIERVFQFEGGIVDFVKYCNEGKQVLNPEPIYFYKSLAKSEVEVALQINDRFDDNIFCFVNNINTREGGTHLTGFKTALTSAINRRFDAIKDESKIIKAQLKKRKVEENFTFDDIKEGLVAVISIKIPDPQFEGQTKMKLGNQYVQGDVQSVCYEKLMTFFEEKPQLTEFIIEKILKAAQGRIAAREARKKARGNGGFGGMPEKLSDCSDKDPANCEIFIVEGDSAGGSAKQGRDRRIQAILPLWGKMLNVEKAPVDKVSDNEKLRPIIVSLGAGVGSDFDVSKVRYHKVMIMADADVDGSHIRTLLLTFFFRFMRPLIEAGYVYFAMPPLFKISIGKEEYFAYDEADKDRYLLDKGVREDSSNVKIQRYKGLGEMNPDQLWETTMNPETRRITRVNLDDAVEADKVFTMLMGEEVEPRRIFIDENAQYVSNLDA